MMFDSHRLLDFIPRLESAFLCCLLKGFINISVYFHSLSLHIGNSCLSVIQDSQILFEPGNCPNNESNSGDTICLVVLSNNKDSIVGLSKYDFFLKV